MQKKLIIILFLIVFLFTGVIYFQNNNTEAFKDFGIKASFTEARFSLFPLPKVIAQDVAIDSLTAKTAECRISIIDALAGNKTCSKVTFYDSKIDLDKFAQFSKNISIPKLELINSEISSKSIPSLNGKFKYINLKLKENDIEVEAKQADKNYINFSMNNKNLKLDLSLNDLDLKAKATIVDNKITDGILDGKIYDPLSLSLLFVKFVPNFTEVINTYSFSEPIIISSNFSYDKEMQFSNFKFSSKDINGTADILMGDKNEIKLDIANINLDNVLKLAPNSPQTVLTHFFDFSNFKDLCLSLNAKAKEVILNDSKIADFEFNLKAKDDQIEEGNLSFKVNDTNFNANNFTKVVVDNQNVILANLKYNSNDFGSDFATLVGKDHFSADTKENINLEGRIIISADEITIDKINAQFNNNGTSANSRITLKIENNALLNDYELNLNNVDFKNYELKVAKKRVQEAILNSNSVSYITDLKWLRDFRNKVNVTINLNNCRIGDNKIHLLDTNFKFKDAGISFEKFTLDSDYGKFSGTLSLVADSLQPALLVSLNGDLIDFSKINNLLFGAQEEVMENKIWSDKEIKFFAFNKFEGALEGKIKEVKTLAGNSVNNLYGKMTMINKNAFINDLSMNIFGGNIDFKGTYSVNENNSLNAIVSFAFNDFYLKDFLNSMINIDWLESSKASVGGSLNLAGKSPAQIIQNLEAQMAFSAVSSKLIGVNLPHILAVASKIDLQVHPNNVKNVVEKDFTSGTTIVDNISGNLKIAEGQIEASGIKFNVDKIVGALNSNINLLNFDLGLAGRISFIPLNFDNYKQDKDGIVVDFSGKGNINDIKFTRQLDDLNKYLDFVYQIGTNNTKTTQPSSNGFIYQKLE